MCSPNPRGRKLWASRMGQCTEALSQAVSSRGRTEQLGRTGTVGKRANAHTWRGTEVSVWGGGLGLLHDLGASCS